MSLGTQIAIFKGQKIRKTFHHNEWWFSVVDVCEVLTESADAGAYWRKLKQRLIEESNEPVTFCHGLKLEAPDGKMRETDCSSTEGMFRIIQSIPSPKAEPFKRWLAKVGYERVQEIENPFAGVNLLYVLKCIILLCCPVQVKKDSFLKAYSCIKQFNPFCPILVTPE